jgi:hypothetical protein
MNTGQIRRRGWLPLVLSWLIALQVGGVSNSVVSAQAPATRIFFDDFNGPVLRPEWTIINPDANRWALVNGNLLLVLNDDTNKFCYKEAVPQQYDFIVKVIPVQRLESDRFSEGVFYYHWEFFYIGIFSGSNEGVQLWTSTSLQKAVWVLIKTSGGVQYRVWNVDEHPNMKEYYLKIRKSDIQYTGLMSYDGSSWTYIGTHYLPGFVAGMPCLGTRANTKFGKAVKVDFVELKAFPPPP